MSTSGPSTKTVALAIALAVVLVVAATAIILSVEQTVHSTGRIVSVGLDVSSDSSFTTPLTQVDWGTLSPGDMAAVYFYARNSGNINVTLSLVTANWALNGIASNVSAFFALSWNYTGQILQPTQYIPLQMTLTVSPQIKNITTFSFDIIITAVNATNVN